MMSTATESRPISTYLFRRPRVRLFSLLALPMTWIVGVYILSLFLLLITAFWYVDPFTSPASDHRILVRRSLHLTSTPRIHT